MDYLINKSTIQNCLGGASFVSGLICFACGSTYDKLFGKLGFGGLIVYLGISLSIFYLIWGFKRIPVPERFQVVVETTLCVAICLISVELDKLVPGKLDALSIISYALFALMSVFVSKKFELGFETGFFTFFLSLFSEQLFKTNWKLFPIALGFCFATLLLRHHSPSDSPNHDRTQEVVPLINATARGTDNHEYYLDLERQAPPRVGQDSGESLSSTSNQENNPEESYEVVHRSPSNIGGVLEESISEVVGNNQQNNDQEETNVSFLARQDSPGMGEVSGQSLLSTDNHQNNPEESSQATHQSPRIVQVSDESILDWVNQNQEEEDPWSLPPESWEQEQILSGNNQNGWMHSPAEDELLPAERSGLSRRIRWLTAGIQNIPSRVGATLGRGRGQVVPAFFFFRRLNPSETREEQRGFSQRGWPI